MGDQCKRRVWDNGDMTDCSRPVVPGTRSCAEHQADAAKIVAIAKYCDVFRRHGFDRNDIDFSSVMTAAIEAMAVALLSLESTAATEDGDDVRIARTREWLANNQLSPNHLDIAAVFRALDVATRDRHIAVAERNALAASVDTGEPGETPASVLARRIAKLEATVAVYREERADDDELIERGRQALIATAEDPVCEREIGVRDTLRALLLHLLPKGQTLDLDTVVSMRVTPEDRRVMAEAGGIAERDLPGGAAEASAAIRQRDEIVERLRGLDTDKRVRFYEHDFYVLSNFSAFTLKWNGIRFDTSEAAYHWEKFFGAVLDEGGPLASERASVRYAIIVAPSAHEAFKIAERNAHLRRRDWGEVKVPIMRSILRAKVRQHEYVKRKLLSTGDRELVEDSWRDGFWGWGQNRDGANMLGRLWMEIRAELRETT